MKVLVLAATGGTGRLIVRFRPGERPFRRGPGLHDPEAVPPMQRVDFSRVQEPASCGTI